MRHHPPRQCFAFVAIHCCSLRSARRQRGHVPRRRVPRRARDGSSGLSTAACAAACQKFNANTGWRCCFASAPPHQRGQIERPATPAAWHPPIFPAAIPAAGKVRCNANQIPYPNNFPILCDLRTTVLVDRFRIGPAHFARPMIRRHHGPPLFWFRLQHWSRSGISITGRASGAVPVIPSPSARCSPGERLIYLILTAEHSESNGTTARCHLW